jgi:hypothetical protein
MNGNAILYIIIICVIFFLLELIVLALATKNPLHIHTNRKVLVSLFIEKDEYLRFKEAAISRGHDSIEPYIEELIEKDIASIEKE